MIKSRYTNQKWNPNKSLLLLRSSKIRKMAWDKVKSLLTEKIGEVRS